ncbi:MAG: hypothetical protein WA208_01195 [Thermoanaerobaculia bacterium]
MKRKIAAAAMILGLVGFTGCRVAAHGKDVVLAVATRTIVRTMDASSWSSPTQAACTSRTSPQPARATAHSEPQPAPTVRG